MIVEIAGSFIAGAACGVTALKVCQQWAQPLFEATDCESKGGAVCAVSEKPAEAEPKPFAVAGKGARVPWHIKRREIEAQHRTKRQRIEEW